MNDIWSDVKVLNEAIEIEYYCYCIGLHFSCLYTQLICCQGKDLTIQHLTKYSFLRYHVYWAWLKIRRFFQSFKNSIFYRQILDLKNYEALYMIAVSIVAKAANLEFAM